MFALIAMLSASCLAAESMTPAQKACCAAMAHDCGEMALTAGCCASHVSKDTSLSTANRVEAAAPQAVPMLVAVLVALEPPAPDARRVAHASTTPVKPPGTSTYLIVSSFRL